MGEIPSEAFLVAFQRLTEDGKWRDVRWSSADIWDQFSPIIKNVQEAKLALESYIIMEKNNEGKLVN